MLKIPQPEDFSWVPKPGEEIICEGDKKLFYATVGGYFETDKGIIALPHRPYPAGILLMFDTQVAYRNVARTFGSTFDRVVYIGDIVLGRTLYGNIIGTVVGIFPDDSVALDIAPGKVANLTRLNRVDVCVTSKGWGRISCAIQ